MTRIAILSNTLSHLNRDSLPGIREMIREQADIVHREIRDIGDIPAIMDEFARLRPDLLVINGGDGTVDAAATYIINEAPFDVPPPIAILPGGKTNMTAADLGARGRPDKMLERLIALARSGGLAGATEPRTLLKLEWHPDDAPLSGFFFGTAAIVRGIEYCRRKLYPLGLPNVLSHFLAIVMLVGMIASPWRRRNSPMRAEAIGLLSDGGAAESGSYFMLTVTTLDSLLLGIRPFSRDGEGSLKLTTIDHSAGAVMRAGWAILRGKAGESPVAGMNCRRAGRIELELDCPFTLDGEMFQPLPGQPVTLSVGGTLPFVRFS